MASLQPMSGQRVRVQLASGALRTGEFLYVRKGVAVILWPNGNTDLFHPARIEAVIVTGEP